MFYLFNLFCGIVLEKEKKENFFIQLNQKTLITSKETLKILVDLNAVDFQVLLQQAFSPTYSRLRQGSAWAQDFKDIWGNIEKPFPRKQTYILKTKVIIFKCTDIMNINLFT